VSDIYGYAGKMLHVDLTTGTLKEEKINDEFARLFVGGAGFCAYYMNTMMKKQVDPLSPESVICVATGPIAGTLMPSATKTVCALKGPAGFYVSSPTSNIGRYLKYAGYDGITIKGRAESPVYLDIFNDDVKLRDAGHIWGKDLFEATDIIKKETRDASVACIGPAGENLVAFANILVNKQGTWCRSGDGAVMGSKNLKGIAVRGTRGVRVADPERFQELVQMYFAKLKDNPHVPLWNDLGLLIGWDAWQVNSGKYVTDNFSNTAASNEMTALYGPNAYRSEVRAGASHCHTCPVGCKSAMEIKSGEFAGLKHIQSTIFSSIESFGAKARVGNYNNLVKCANTINGYGMDNLTFCSKMDMVCDLYNRGILKAEDIPGWEPRKGFEATMELMKLVATRKGVGDILAKTWGEMSDEFGEKVKDHVVHIKGTDPANDMRTHICTENFGQLVCSRGGHNMNALSITIVPHRKMKTLVKFAQWIGVPEDQIEKVIPSEHENEYVPALTKWIEDYNVMLLNLGLCNRPPYQQMFNPDGCAELFEATTGLHLTGQEVLASGERAQVMERIFNCHEGFTKREDSPPVKWMREPTWVDGRKIEPLKSNEVNSMLERYYEERGWNMDGVPDSAKAKQLGIGNLMNKDSLSRGGTE